MRLSDAAKGYLLFLAVEAALMVGFYCLFEFTDILN